MPTDSLPLTLDNVELVLNEMRPYLMADGGNVAVSSIEGPVVKLELQVPSCGIVASFRMIHCATPGHSHSQQRTNQTAHCLATITGCMWLVPIKRNYDEDGS